MSQTNPFTSAERRPSIEGPFQPEEVQLANRNSGILLETLRHDVTPAGLHYLLNHFDVPFAAGDGWKVEVGGRERPLLRADSIFRAVALEAGRHRVVFHYAPRSWHVGLALGALGLVSAAAGAWWLARRSTAR